MSLNIGNLNFGVDARTEGIDKAIKKIAQFQKLTDNAAKSQKKGAEQVDNAAFVITHRFWRDPKQSPNVSHSHHWCGNAESYFLVGDALGKAFIELVDGKPAAAGQR